MDRSSAICFEFEPQKWRKSKCKHCFRDIELHVGFSSDGDNCYSELDNSGNENKYKTTDTASNLSNEQRKADLKEELDHEVLKITKKIKAKKSNNGKQEDTPVLGDSATEKASVYSVGEAANVIDMNEQSEKADFLLLSRSFEEESPSLHRKHSLEAECLLTRSSCMEFSSTSSLASFDALEDNTLSSYSYSGSRDNLDGFASGDELCFQDKTVEKPIPILTEKQPADYEEEIDNLQDRLKYLERDKDRVTQALERELEGLKLQLATYSARENITIVKNRLELEGKNQAIQELEEENCHLRSAVEDLRCNRDSEETQYDWLQGKIKRRNKRLQCLEDEKKTLEERLKLAEDLQKNDRDLLDVLRNQLTSLESDLLSAEDKNKQLEGETRKLKSIENDLKEERQISHKVKRHVEFLNGKLKVREQHVSYLEEDNVSMQQEKSDLEMKLEKDREKIERLNSVVKELKKEVKECHEEIEKLSEENSQLEQAHWQVVINQNDTSGQLESYIKDLEKRASQGEGRIRELEAENESVINQSSELLENLVLSQEEVEESKRQLDLITGSYSRLQSIKTDQEKRMMTMQRKLKKLQKEKKKFQIEKQEADEKISLLKMNDDKVSSKCDDLEKGYKMLQLKLKSTEAKLTMVESNKIYIETKLKEYENKFKINNNKVSKLDSIVCDYLKSVGEYQGAEAGADVIETFEVNLTKIVDLSGKLKSQLKEYEDRNTSLLRMVDFGEKRIEKISEFLEVTQNEKDILKYLLDEKNDDCQRVHEAFLTGIASLANQNDFLEEKLSEMRVLESEIKSCEDRLDSVCIYDIEETESQFVPGQACNDSGIESSTYQNEPASENQDVNTCTNAATDVSGILPIEKDDVDQKSLSNYQQLSCMFSEFENEPLSETNKPTVDSSCCRKTSLGASFSPSSEDNFLSNHEKGLFEWCKESGIQEMEHYRPETRDGDKADLLSNTYINENIHDAGEKQCLEKTKDYFSSSFRDPNVYERDDIPAQEPHIDIKIEEGSCQEIECPQMTMSSQEDETEEQYVDIDCSEQARDGGNVELSCTLKNVEAQKKMESSRPFTSIKCIFQVETDHRGSLLDYSENQVKNDISSEGRKGNEQRDSHGSYYSIAASNVGFTPLQTEVAHPIQKEAANEINATKRKDSTPTARSHKAGIGQLYQISQEDCGAITLTIPSASLEGEDLESDAALSTGNRNEVVIERVSLLGI
eukprot:gene8727-14748_t